MEVNFSERVAILGVDYTIEVKKKEDEPGFKRQSTAWGFCDSANQRLVILDRRDDKIYTENKMAYDGCCEWMRKTLRHEIVHAFFHESGLCHNTKFLGAWSMNEEMVDWIALQGPKLIKAWMDAGAL